METATKAPKKKKKKSCIHSQPLSCSTNGKVMEKKLTDSCSKLCRDAFQCPCCFHFFTCTKKKKEEKYVFTSHQSLSHHITVTCQAETTSLLLLTALYTALCVWVRCCFLSTPCRSALTSKQYSCPRMLEWTGLMMASSSSVRSSASAALLGDSKDSWEWDSLKLCIKRVLGGVIVVVRCAGGRGSVTEGGFSSVYEKLMEDICPSAYKRDVFFLKGSKLESA